MTNLQPGQAFGPYSIINQIGSADSVTTYKAYDSTKARDITLKIFSAALAQSANFATRFEQATSTARKLTHAHILAVYDAGQIDGVPYMLTRDIGELRTLTERLASGSLSPTEITQVFKQIAEALSYVHTQGVTHGALNPDNILLDSSGNVSLADLGLASLLPHASSAYSSPEQASGGAMDAHADIFSLGAVLYTMVTGHAPSSEDASLSESLKQLSDSLPMPSHLKTEFASKAERIIRQALSANQGERFASVADLLDAWQRAQATTTAPVQPPSQGTVDLAQATAQRIEAEAHAKAAQDAARAAAEQATLSEAARKAKHEAERQAREHLSPQQRDALRNVAREAQTIAAQKAQAEKARLARAAEEARNKAQSSDAHVSHAEAEAKRAAAMLAARVAAVNELKAEAERKAQTAAPPAYRASLAGVQTAQRRARPIALTLIVIALTVCVGIPALCIGAFALIPDTTPTPTRAALTTATLAAKVNTSTPLAPTTNTPRASPTLRPSATPTRDITSDAVLVFTDAFKTGDCTLAEGDNERRTYTCDNGEYVMLHKTSGSRWAYYDDQYRDTVIEVDGHVISGAAFVEYGVVFRVASDGKSLYGVSLTREGKFTIFRYNDSNFTDLFPYIQSSAIKTGTATNHIKVVMQQNQISAYVNGTFLGSVTDSNFQSGAVGLFLNSDEPNARAAFSNLRISEIGRPALLPSRTPIIRATPTR